MRNTVKVERAIMNITQQQLADAIDVSRTPSILFSQANISHL